MKIKNPENYFYASNGDVLKSLDDLLGYLKTASDGSFYHHVNSEKNDFANWIKEVLKKDSLSEEIRKMNSRGDFVKAIEAGLGLKNKAKRRKQSIISKIKGAHK